MTFVVVLVDDHDFAPGLARALTAHDRGLMVIHAGDLDALAAHLAAVIPDLVVTDLRLPGAASPTECLDRVRDLWPGPLAVLSGDDSAEAHSACVTRVATQWTKPLPVDELAVRMRGLIDHHSDRVRALRSTR